MKKKISDAIKRARPVYDAARRKANKDKEAAERLKKAKKEAAARRRTHAINKWVENEVPKLIEEAAKKGRRSFKLGNTYGSHFWLPGVEGGVDGGELAEACRKEGLKVEREFVPAYGGGSDGGPDWDDHWIYTIKW